MFNFLKGKKAENEGAQLQESSGSREKESEVQKEDSAGLVKITTDIERLKAGFESFQEIRKAFGERFDTISEQIGELRAMILDRDKTMQELELKAVKAADLVESVQPEKLMATTQKQEAKIEALKANIEGNEAMTSRVMEELKEVRRKVEFFRGVEEIIKLSEEVKKELIEIKRAEAAINLKSDKVDTLYTEIRKKFENIDLFKDNLKEIEVSTIQNTKDVDSIKSKITGLADKADVEAIVEKVQRYIGALKDLEKKSSLTKDLEQLKAIIDGVKS